MCEALGAVLPSIRRGAGLVSSLSEAALLALPLSVWFTAATRLFWKLQTVDREKLCITKSSSTQSIPSEVEHRGFLKQICAAVSLGHSPHESWCLGSSHSASSSPPCAPGFYQGRERPLCDIVLKRLGSCSSNTPLPMRDALSAHPAKPH